MASLDCPTSLENQIGLTGNQRKESWTPHKSRNAIDAHRVRHQRQSALFRLPVELRLFIWEYVFALDPDDSVLHINVIEGGIKYCRCSQTERCFFTHGHSCWDDKIWWEGMVGDEVVYLARSDESQANKDLLAVLTICKVLCKEVMDLLYESSILDVREASTIVQLPKLLPTSRLCKLRSLRFSTKFGVSHMLGPPGIVFDASPAPINDEYLDWIQACSVLTSLDNLKYLHITLYLRELGGPWNENTQARHIETILQFIRPLSPVAAQKFFVVLECSSLDIEDNGVYVPDELQVRLEANLPFELSMWRPPQWYFDDQGGTCVEGVDFFPNNPIHHERAMMNYPRNWLERLWGHIVGKTPRVADVTPGVEAQNGRIYLDVPWRRSFRKAIKSLL